MVAIILGVRYRQMFLGFFLVNCQTGELWELLRIIETGLLLSAVRLNTDLSPCVEILHFYHLCFLFRGELSDIL